MSPSNQLMNLYNPANQSKQTLLDNFVIRKNEFDTIYRILKHTSVDHIAQNILIIGLRGTGKTTLLLRTHYEIDSTPEFSHIVPIQFSEEQYNIYSLARLWENIADRLEDVAGFEGVSEPENTADNYDRIRVYLRKNKKKLLLLIDNFGNLLNKFTDLETKKLRDLLHEPHLQIIAGSLHELEQTYKHDKPFFEFFKTLHLEGLSSAETEKLLCHLAKHHQDPKIMHALEHQKARIETMRRLTGGIPRTIVLLYEIIADGSDSIFEDLNEILDKITPLYKHRMDDLSTQQQVIIDAMARYYHGMTASEISVSTQLESKKISAQLRILEKNDLILSQHVDKKNKMYMMKERFFNIWYLMRYGGKKHKQHLLWLVSFINEWYSQEEIIERAKAHISHAKRNQLNPVGAYYMAEALAANLDELQLKDDVLVETKNFLTACESSTAESLSTSPIDLLNNGLKFLSVFIEGTTPSKSDVLFFSAVIELAQSKYTTGVKTFKQFLRQGGKQNLVTHKFIIVLLCAQKQYQLAMQLLNDTEFNLKNQNLPLYYATMFYLQDEYPKEYKRMGSELRETVEEILVVYKEAPELILRLREHLKPTQSECK